MGSRLALEFFKQQAVDITSKKNHPTGVDT
jgi:hypothetical protein